MRHKLEFQADRIEAVLSLNKVQARVTGGTVTPRWIRFQLLPAVGAKISRIKNLSEELAAALDAPNCRVSRRGAFQGCSAYPKCKKTLPAPKTPDEQTNTES